MIFLEMRFDNNSRTIQQGATLVMLAINTNSGTQAL